MFLFNNSIKSFLIKTLPILALFAFVLVTSDTALADDADEVAACGDSNGLGGVLCNVFDSFHGVPGLFAGFSYIFGLVLAFMGILKIKEHVENPNQVQIWDPIKRFLAGGAFLGLPTIINVVKNTLSKDIDTINASNGYNTGGVSGSGLDEKLVSLMKDIWDPMHYTMVGFSILAGTILLMIGISRLLKSEQDGPRGPMGLGTIMTFLVAGALFSINNLLGAASESIFNEGAQTYAVLKYTDGMEDGGKHANAVIGAIMAFVAILGWISFIRGFFIMRGVAEGNSQSSAMAGVTHILGGAIAVNLGAFIKAVQETLKIQDYGLVISSIEPYLTDVTFLA